MRCIGGTMTSWHHHDDVIMGAMASQITSLTIVYSTVYSGDKKTPSKFHVTGLCAGNSPGTGEFLAQMASHAENVSIWERHHVGTLSTSWALWEENHQWSIDPSHKGSGMQSFDVSVVVSLNKLLSKANKLLTTQPNYRCFETDPTTPIWC